MSADNTPPAASHKTRRRWVAGLLALAALGGLGVYLWHRSRAAVGVPKTLDPVRTLTWESDHRISQLAFYPDGKWLVAGEGAKRMIVWDVTDGEKVATHDERGNHWDGSDLHDDRFRKQREWWQAVNQFRAYTAGDLAGLPHALTPIPLEAKDFDLTRRRSRRATGGFGWSTSGDRGAFCVAEDGKQAVRVLGFTGAEYAWDRTDEYDQGPPEKAGDQVVMSQYSIAGYTFEPNKSHSSSRTWTDEGKMPSQYGFSADGTRLLLGWPDGKIRLAEIRPGEFTHSEVRALAAFPGGTKHTPIALLPDGQAAVMMNEEGAGWENFGVWDLQTGKQLSTFDRRPHLGFGPLAASRDGRRLLLSLPVDAVTLWNLETGEAVREFPLNTHVRQLALSSDGSRILTAGGDKLIRLWDAGDGRELARLAHPDADPTAMAFSPDGRKVAVASGNEVRVWDLP